MLKFIIVHLAGEKIGDVSLLHMMVSKTHMAVIVILILGTFNLLVHTHIQSLELQEQTAEIQLLPLPQDHSLERLELQVERLAQVHSLERRELLEVREAGRLYQSCLLTLSNIAGKELHRRNYDSSIGFGKWTNRNISG